MVYRDRLLEQANDIAASSDFFFQEKLVSALAESSSATYFKRDFVFVPGIWRGFPQAPIWRPPWKKRTVVIGHSDIPMNCGALMLVKLFSQSRVFCSNLVCPRWVVNLLGASVLPLGLSNPTHETVFHPIFGNSTQIVEALQTRRKEIPLTIYANFDPRTSPSHRLRLMEICKNLPHVKMGRLIPTAVGRAKYLREMSEYRLVVCPQGNGMDTHRFWEALYVGAVPLVLADSYQAKMATTFGLPHVPLNTWDELSDESTVLELGRAVIENSAYSLKLARGSYWMQQVLQFS